MSSATITICGVEIKIAFLSLCCLVAQTTAAVILTRYSKTLSKLPLADGTKREPYHNTSLVAMTEIVKFFSSLLLVFIFDTREKIGRQQQEDVENPSCVPSPPATALPVPRLCSAAGLRVRYDVWKKILYDENFVNILGTLKLAVPALLYTVQNNVIYVALNNLEATTFQVGYQSKVVTTAVLSVLMLNRTLSIKKWIALFLLTTGIILTQIVPSAKTVPEASQRGYLTTTIPITTTTLLPSDAASVLHAGNRVIGLVAVLTAAFCSAFAGVYFEKILKGSAPSVWVRNAQLAFFSTIIGLIGYVVSVENVFTFFQGYCPIAVLLILIQALGGLIIACVVKYADNIMKGFATALSIVMCGVLSAFFFGFIPSVLFAVGSIIVIVATFLYSQPDNP